MLVKLTPRRHLSVKQNEMNNHRVGNNIMLQCSYTQQVSGGLSPFWAGNEYRTQRYILRGKLVNGGFDQV